MPVPERTRLCAPLTVLAKLVVLVPALMVLFVPKVSALLKLIALLLVVTLPESVVVPVTVSAPSDVVEPTAPPKVTVLPVTVKLQGPPHEFESVAKVPLPLKMANVVPSLPVVTLAAPLVETNDACEVA